MVEIANTTDQLKEISVIDANTTPPTIGTSEPNTRMEGLCIKENAKDYYICIIFNF
jgi:hypothetical protein